MSEDMFEKDEKEIPGMQEKSGEEPGSYHLVYETTKKRPVSVKKKLQQVLWTALCALIFGLVAALVIAQLVPVFTRKEEAEAVHLTSGEDTSVPAEESAVEGTDETDTGDTADDENAGSESTPEDGKAQPEDEEAEDTADAEESGEDAGDAGDAENTGENGDDGEDGDHGEDGDAGEDGTDTEPGEDIAEIPLRPDSAEDRLEYNAKLFNDIRNIGNESRRFVVQVAGITTVEDWFENVDEDRALTSGAVIADDGAKLIIVTDGNIVENANSIAVTFYNDSVAVATFGKKDPVTGLAIISVNKSDLSEETLAGIRVAVISPSGPQVPGDQVIALGSPVGFPDSIIFGQVTSAGNRLSLTDREYGLVITDIHGSPQGSGVLVNMKGELTGIIAQQYCPLTDGGVITALPIGEIKGLIEDLSNNRDLAKLGITGETVTSDISVSTGVPLGVYVTDVEIDSPAFLAGIHRGDIINGIGGENIATMYDIQAALSPEQAGNAVTVSLKRSSINGYTDMELEVELGSE